MQNFFYWVYKSLDEFEFGQNLTSFLIGSSSFLQVTRTTIKAWMSSNFGGIPPLTSELAALELLKNRTISLLAL